MSGNGLPLTPLTPAQAAERLGVNEETVRRYIKSGRLQAGRLGVNYVLHPQDVDDLRRSLARVKLAKAVREAGKSLNHASLEKVK